jgi:hypothetical protein
MGQAKQTRAADKEFHCKVLAADEAHPGRSRLRGRCAYDFRQFVFRGSGSCSARAGRSSLRASYAPSGRPPYENKTAEKFRSGFQLQRAVLNCGCAGTLSWLHVRDHLSRDHILQGARLAREQADIAMTAEAKNEHLDAEAR